MDIMKFKDILLVGVPETLLSLLLGMYIFKGRYIEYNKNAIGWRRVGSILIAILKYILSIVLILSVIQITRSKANDLLIIIGMSTFIYSWSFRNIMRHNFVQSLLSGLLVIFIIMSLEVIVFPVSAKLLPPEMLQGKFFDHRFMLSLPSRCIQIIMLIVLRSKELNLKNNELLVTKWALLTPGQKKTVSRLIFFMFVSVVLNYNYVEMFIKFQVHKVPKEIYDFNLNLFLAGTILFILQTVDSFIRTTSHETIKNINKEMLNDPIEHFKKLAMVSPPDLLQEYIKISNEQIVRERREEVNEAKV